MTKTILLTISIICSASIKLIAQETEWFVLNDAGGSINAIGIEPDALGNVFTFGNYTGESRFNSADSLGPSTVAYASPNWKHNYIQKVNALGQLEFVCHIKTKGSNMDYAEIRKMKVLPNGNVAFYLYTKYGFEIQDASKTIHTFRSNQKSFLLILSNDGSVIKAKELPLTKCVAMDVRGSELLLLGEPQRYVSYNQHLWSIDFDGNQLVVLSDNMNGVRDIHFYNDKLWLLHYVQLSKQRYNTSDGYFLSYMGIDNVRKTISSDTIAFGLARSTSPSLIVRKNQIELAVLVQNAGKLVCNNIEYPAYNLETGLFTFNTNSKLTGNTLLNTRTRNIEIHGTNDGGIIVNSLVYDSLIVGKKFVMKAPKHNDYIYESVFFKLDKNLKFEWFVNGGGSSSVYATTSFCVVNRNVCISSILYDYIDLSSDRRFVNWKMGSYVWSINY